MSAEAKRQWRAAMQKPNAAATLKKILVRLGVEAKCEFHFDPVRKWRFDLAIPDALIALELDGGIWTGGRHTRGAGYSGDMAKLNAAQLAGWRVFHVEPSQATGEGLRLIQAALEGGR